MDGRVRKTKAALAEAVIGLAAERDFATVSVADITKRACVGYATFFRHYTSKDELLADVADLLIDELLAVMLPALLAEDTAKAAVALCRFVDARRPICRALLAGGAEAAVRRELIRRAEARALALNMPQPVGLPPSLLIGHAVVSAIGLLAWWLDQGEGVDVAMMAAIIDRLVLKPVRPGPTD